MDPGAAPACDTMNIYYRSILALTVIGSLAMVSGCTQIKLSDKKGGGKPASTDTASQQPNNGSPAAQPQAPPVQGQWTITFSFQGKEVSADMQLEQQGNQLAGQGADQSGTPWAVTEGTVTGNSVRFVKTYTADRPPVVYEGELKWLADPGYTGWMIEGNYKTQDPQGNVISDAFVATPADPSAMPPPANFNAAPPVDHTSNAPIDSNLLSSQQPAHTEQSVPDDGHAPHLSGRYDGEYEFNFKKIKMKMWLEQDNDRVTGHGVDVNTNEKFVIEKGWYKHPKLTLVRKYFKGTGAAATREFTFKGTVKNGPKGPVMKGETQFGGDWSASIVR